MLQNEHKDQASTKIPNYPRGIYSRTLSFNSPKDTWEKSLILNFLLVKRLSWALRRSCKSFTTVSIYAWLLGNYPLYWFTSIHRGPPTEL